MSKYKSPKKSKPKDGAEGLDMPLIDINTGEIIQKASSEYSELISLMLDGGIDAVKKENRKKEKSRANAIRDEFERNMTVGDKILRDVLNQRIKSAFKGLNEDAKKAFGDYEHAEVESSIARHIASLNKMVNDSILYGLGVDKNELSNKIEEMNSEFSSQLIEGLSKKMRGGRVYTGPSSENEGEVEAFNMIVDSAKMKIQELSDEFKESGEFSGNLKILLNELESVLSGEHSPDVIFRDFFDLQHKYRDVLTGQSGINEAMETVIESFKWFGEEVDPEEIAKVMKEVADNTINPIKKIQDFDMSKYKALMGGIASAIKGLIADIYTAEKEIFAIAAITDMQGAEVSRFRTEMSALAVTLPFTTRELASSYGDLVRTGKSAAEASVILRSVGDLAIATFEPLGKVTSNVNALVLAMELSADKTTEVTRTLFNVLNTTPLGFESLSAALTQTGAAFNSVIGQTSKTGEELEDYKMELTKLQSSLIGGMSLLGKTGSQAGTAIRNMTTRLQSMEAAAKTAVDADLVRAGGFVSSTGLVIKTAQDLSELASEDFMKVTQVLSEMSKTGVLSFDAMRKLFTGRNVTQIAGVLAQVDGNVELFNKRMSEMGDLSKAAEIAGKSWVQQYKQLSETFGDFKNMLGDFADAFSGIMSIMNYAMSGIAKLIAESPAMKGATLGVTTFTGALTSMFVLSQSHTAMLKMLTKYYGANIANGFKFANVISTIGKSFVKFVAGNKIGLAISVVAGLAVALNEMRKHAEAVRNEAKKTIVTYENQIETYKLTNEASRKMLKTSEENIAKMTSIFDRADLSSEFENIFYGFDDGRAAIIRLNTALKEFIVVAQKSRDSLKGDKGSSDRLKEEVMSAAEQSGYGSEAYKKAVERKETYEKAEKFVNESGISMETLKAATRGGKITDYDKVVGRDTTMQNILTGLGRQGAGIDVDKLKIKEIFERMIDDNIDPADFTKEFGSGLGELSKSLRTAVEKSYQVYYDNSNGLVDAYESLTKEQKEAFSSFSELFSGSGTGFRKAMTIFFQEDQKTQEEREKALKERYESEIRLNSQTDQLMKSSTEEIKNAVIKAYDIESKSGVEFNDALEALKKEYPQFAAPFVQAVDSMHELGLIDKSKPSTITKEKIAAFRKSQASFTKRITGIVTRATADLALMSKGAILPTVKLEEGKPADKGEIQEAIKNMFAGENSITGKVEKETERRMYMLRDSAIRQIDEEVSKPDVKKSEIPIIVEGIYKKLMSSMEDMMITDFKYASETMLGNIELAMAARENPLDRGMEIPSEIVYVTAGYWEKIPEEMREMQAAMGGLIDGDVENFSKNIATLKGFVDKANAEGESKIATTLTAIIEKYTKNSIVGSVYSGVKGMDKIKPEVLSTYMEEYNNSRNELIDSIEFGNDEIVRYLNESNRKILDSKKAIHSALGTLSGKELDSVKIEELNEAFEIMSKATTSGELTGVAKKLIANAERYGIDKSTVDNLEATIFNLGDNTTRIISLIGAKFSEIDSVIMSNIKSLGGIEDYTFLDSTIDGFEELMLELGKKAGLSDESIKKRVATIKENKTKEIELESVRAGVSEALGVNNFQGAINISARYSNIVEKRKAELKEIEDALTDNSKSEKEREVLEAKRLKLSTDLANLQIETLVSEMDIQKAIRERIKELKNNFFTELEGAVTSALSLDNKKLSTEDSFSSMAKTMSSWFVNSLRPDNDPNKIPGADMKTLIKLTNSMLDYAKASKMEKAMDSIDKKITNISRAQKDIDRRSRLADDIQEKAALFNEEQVLAEELTRLEIEKSNIEQLTVAQIHTDQLYDIIHELQQLQLIAAGDKDKTQNQKNIDFGNEVISSFKGLFSSEGGIMKGLSEMNMSGIMDKGLDMIKGVAGNFANQTANQIFSKWTGDAALGQTLGGITQMGASLITMNPMDVINGGLSAIQGLSKGLFGDKKAEKEMSKKIEEHNEKIKDAVADFNFEMLVSKLESINSGIRQVSDNITKYGLRGAYNMYMSQSGSSMTGAGAAEYVSHTERYGGSWIRRRRRKDVLAAVTETMDLKRIGDILGGDYKEALGDYRLNSADEMKLALEGAKKIQQGLTDWRGSNTGAQHAKGDYGKQWAQSSAMLDATNQIIDKLQGVQKLYADNLDKFNSQLFGFTVEFIDEFGNIADSSEEIVDVIITEWDKLAGILDSVASNIFQETSSIGDAIYSAIFDSAAQALSKSDQMVSLGDELAKLVYDFSKTFIPKDMDTTGATANLNQMEILNGVLGVMDKMKEEELRLKEVASALAEGMLALGGDIKELRPYLSIDFQTMDTQVSHYQEKYTEAMQEIKTELYNAFKAGKGPIAITEANMVEYNKALADYIASQQAAKDVTDYITDEFTNKFLSGEISRPFEDVAEYMKEEVVEMRNIMSDFFKAEDMSTAASNFGKSIGDKITGNIIDKMLDTQKYRNALNTIYKSVDAIIEKGSAVSFAELSKIAQDAQKYSMMMDQERQKIQAMKDMFNFDSEVVYDTTQDTINYQTSSSKESVYNIYQTNNFDIGNFVSTRATMEEFSDMIAPHLARSFDNLGL